jgi:hypothetical protein
MSDSELLLRKIDHLSLFPFMGALDKGLKIIEHNAALA